MRTRAFARGLTAAPGVFVEQSVMARRASLLAGCSLVALAASLTPAAAVVLNASDQASFASAIATVTSNGTADTVNVTSGPIITVHANGSVVTFPGSSASDALNLNIGSGIWFAVGNPDSGTQTLNIGAGTAITLSPATERSRIQVGVNGGNGTVNMTGGSINITEAGTYGTLDVGRGTDSVGVFNQSAGSVVTGGALQIGYEGGKGTYNLSGGTLEQSVGSYGPHFYIGQGLTGDGVLNISGTGQLIMDSTDYVDLGNNGGTGTINQTGGSAKFGGAFVYVGGTGETPGSPGTGFYNLLGGTLDITAGQFLIGFDGGKGTLTQSGGTLTSSVNVKIGDSGATGQGTYTISAGTATFSNGFTIANGSGATGTVNQSGGTISVTGGSAVTFGSGTGVYNLTGGTLQIGGTNGITGSGNLKLGGGTIKITSIFSTSVATALTTGTSMIDTNGNAATWSSVISGSGNLTKAGSGTLTLSGANNYTGATNIIGGKLALSGAGVIASSSGVSLSNDGIFDISAASGARTIKDLSGTADTSVVLGANGLTFGTAASTTFDGDFVGPTGTLFKNNGGTFTFGGTSSSSGDVVINGGKLITTHIDAFSLSKVSLSNNVTWDLAGTGNQKLAILSLGGDGNHVVMTLGNGHDFIQATNKLSLDGVLDLHTGDGNWTPLTTPTTIMTGVNEKSGSFDSFTEDLDFLNATLSYPNNSDVAVSWVKSGATFVGIATTPNQKAAGGAIDLLPLGNPVYAAVATHNGANALAIIDDLSGDFHATTKDLLITDASFLAGVANGRLDLLGAPNGGGGADLPVPAAVPAAGKDVWIQGYGQAVSLADASGNAGDTTGSHFGVLGGVEGGSGNWAGGAAGGYGRANVASASRSASAAIDSVNLLAYASGDLGNVDLRVGGTYSFNTVASTRTILAETLVASYKARTGQVFGEIDADLGAVKPFAGVNYINVSTDAFTETGGPSALTAAVSTANITYSTLGLRAESGDIGGGATVRGMAGWRHAFGDVTPLSSMTLQGQSYTVAGVPIAANAFVAEAGVDVPVSPNLTLSASYAGQISANSQDHGGRATATLKF